MSKVRIEAFRNKLKGLSWEELHELLDKKENDLGIAEQAPISYYSAGYADTYLSAMSQWKRHEGLRKDIEMIWEAIYKTHEEK